MMNEFNTWLTAKGIDPETVSTAMKPVLQAQWRAEIAAETHVEPKPAPSARQETPAAAVKVDSTSFDEKMAAIDAENVRIETIRAMVLESSQKALGNPERVRQIKALGDAAVADSKTTVKDFQLGLLRVDRFSGPLVMAGSTPQINDAVIEAAVCKAGRLENIDKHFDPRTLESADKSFNSGLGIQDLLALCARRNGWRGSSVKAALATKDFFRAAGFGGGAYGDNYGLMAGDTGPSTYSLPNILANIANKFLKVGFDSVDTAWRSIASTRSVNDFKTNTTVELTGSMLFRKLAPSGEIKHGTVSETVYTNKADTYAIMLGIARTDLINDDLGALTSVGRRIGRGAALKINDVFWTVFLNNSSFFTSGNSNVITGGTSALSSAALKLADQKFRVQTDPDGLPLAAMPRILVVPPTLLYAARELMNSSLMVGTTTANALLPATNIFQGAYTLVSSPYMENSTYTGNSAAAWYLLADPNDYSAIEVVFVNGRDTPVVDTAEADFNQLGIGMRGYIDFGAALQEYRAGVRAAGS